MRPPMHTDGDPRFYAAVAVAVGIGVLAGLLRIGWIVATQ